MPTLDLTFLDVYTAVSNYLGMGNPTTVTAELDKVKKIVKRGYRKFLMPLDMSTVIKVGRTTTTAKPYRWAFLRQTSTLATVVNQEEYDLPAEYNGMIISFRHTTDDTYNPVEVPLEVIYQKKSESTNQSYPLYFAIKEGTFDKVVGRRRTVMFWPIPDQVYNFFYTYRSIPLAPVEDNDFFVGPVGSSEAILETCLGVAELQENDIIGVHNQEADRLTQQLIGDDKLSSLIGNIGGMTKDGRPRRSSKIFFDNAQIIPAN